MTLLRFTPSRAKGTYSVSLGKEKIATLLLHDSEGSRTITPTGRALSPEERRSIEAYQPKP